MDKNQITGLLIISVILIAYTHFWGPKPNLLINDGNTSNISEDIAKNSVKSSSHKSVDIADNEILDEDFVLENVDIRVTFTSKGGSIKEVILKKYDGPSGERLVLLDGKSNIINQTFTLDDGEVIDSKLLNFSRVNEQSNSDNNTVVLTATTKNNRTLLFKYTIPTQGYVLTQEFGIKNDKLGADFVSCKSSVLAWNDSIKRSERDIRACRNKTTIGYYSSDGSFDYLNETSTKVEIENLNKPLKWIAIKQRFFTAAVIASDEFEKAKVELAPTQNLETTVKEASAVLHLSTKQSFQKLTFYFGPNDYKTLKNVTQGLDKLIPLGWQVFRWINTLIVIPIFDFLKSHVSNFGLIIILLVFLIKILILPISYRAYISTVKLKIIKPAIDLLKGKFGDNPHQFQMEQMKLYKQLGVNPLGGLGLALLQMPILLAMFNFIPNQIAFRQKPFLKTLLPWAADLSTYDVLFDLPFSIPGYGDHVSLFTLLMAVSTFLHTAVSGEIRSQQLPVKIFAYAMPITFMFIFNNFCAALCFYYFISNLTTLGIQAVIKTTVNEEKIKQKLEENRKRILSKAKESNFKDKLSSLISNRNTKSK